MAESVTASYLKTLPVLGAFHDSGAVSSLLQPGHSVGYLEIGCAVFYDHYLLIFIYDHCGLQHKCRSGNRGIIQD